MHIWQRANTKSENTSKDPSSSIGNLGGTEKWKNHQITKTKVFLLSASSLLLTSVLSGCLTEKKTSGYDWNPRLWFWGMFTLLVHRHKTDVQASIWAPVLPFHPILSHCLSLEAKSSGISFFLSDKTYLCSLARIWDPTPVINISVGAEPAPQCTPIVYEAAAWSKFHTFGYNFIPASAW